MIAGWLFILLQLTEVGFKVPRLVYLEEFSICNPFDQDEFAESGFIEINDQAILPEMDFLLKFSVIVYIWIFDRDNNVGFDSYLNSEPKRSIMVGSYLLGDRYPDRL